MKIQTLTITAMMLLVMNSRANVQAFPLMAEDPILLLQKNYPSVYNTLLHDFSKATSLNYTVEGDVLHISFTSNSNRIFAVYASGGKLRYSITYVGLALPGMVTRQLKETYPAYSVYYGKEIRTDNNILYQVIIENEHEYRVINILDGEMREVRRNKK
jgi:hypothetical protein